MFLLSPEQNKRLQKLFEEKKFSELELEIESICDFKNRPSFLANLLGVAKLNKNSISENDWLEARALFFEAYDKDNSSIDALSNYVNISIKFKDINDVNKVLDILLEKKKIKYHPKVNNLLARIYFFTGEVEKEIETYKEIYDNNDLTTITSSQFLTSLNYSSNFNQQEYLNYCKSINKQFEISPLEKLKLNSFNFDENLRIGFFSADFKEHSIYYFLKTLFNSFKENKIKILIFNLSSKKYLDEKSNEILKDCDEWVDLHDSNDFDSANIIRKKKVNILIDLMGYFGRNRFQVLKYKPAPIQVSWMGYVNTTGIKEIDYLIADENLIKSGEEKFYSEKIIKMPKIWNSHCGLDKNLIIEELPYFKNKFFTFGSLNNFTKISENCLIAWAEILKKIPNSKLLLKSSSRDSEIMKEKILMNFKNNYIEEDRIILLDFIADRNNHLNIYNQIDMGLDTFPYPGVTTTFEAIWMGVPVLTMMGSNFVSRCGESININCDLKKFNAHNFDDYINKAVLLSQNYKDLSKLRKNLRDQALNSPLFDKKQFGDSFSSVLKNLWEAYCKKK